MIINLDMDGLRDKKSALLKELEKVNTLLDLVDQYSLTPPQANLTAVQLVHTNSKKRHPVSGKRKAVTMALHTGPASESEIAQLLNWEVRDVTSVVNSMLTLKLVFLNEHGKLQLSQEGKTQALWFCKHPGHKVYCPDKVVQR